MTERPVGAGNAGVAGVAVCAASVGLFACYLRLSATFPVGSDGASNALEAWDLLHGNWLLRGWTLTDVSFYTTELPEYAAVELARGLNTGVVHTAAALTYTLLVLAAAALARGRARGPEGLARALIAAGIMVAPQLGNGIHVLLSQPDHVGTQVPLLGIFLLLDRAPRRWYTVAAVCALLITTIVADKIAIAGAALPLVIVCLCYAARAQMPNSLQADPGPGPKVSEPSGLARRRTGSPIHRRTDSANAVRGGTGGRTRRRTGSPIRIAGRVRAHPFELSVAVAAIVAVGVAELILVGITRLGGFTLLPVETRMVTPAGVPGHLSMTLLDTLNLFGADVASAQPEAQAAFAWLHAPGIALATAAFAIALWRLPRRGDLVSDALAIGLVLSLADFVASAIPSTPFDTREMVAVLPYGAVLAGRIFGSWLASGNALRTQPSHIRPSHIRPSHVRPSHIRPPRRRLLRVRAFLLSGLPRRAVWLRRFQRSVFQLRAFPRKAGVAALALAGACQLVALGYGATRTAAANPEQALAGWLADRHLTAGLGTYTEDNVTTLDSGGAVRLRTVSWPPSGRAVPRLYQSSAAWYDPRTAYANFVVTGAADGTADLIPRTEILALAGPPARTYRFESFTIMVWHENLLALLAAPPSLHPGDIGHSLAVAPLVLSNRPARHRPARR